MVRGQSFSLEDDIIVSDGEDTSVLPAFFGLRRDQEAERPSHVEEIFTHRETMREDVAHPRDEIFSHTLCDETLPDHRAVSGHRSQERQHPDDILSCAPPTTRGEAPPRRAHHVEPIVEAATQAPAQHPPPDCVDLLSDDEEEVQERDMRPSERHRKEEEIGDFDTQMPLTMWGDPGPTAPPTAPRVDLSQGVYQGQDLMALYQQHAGANARVADPLSTQRRPASITSQADAQRQEHLLRMRLMMQGDPDENAALRYDKRTTYAQSYRGFRGKKRFRGARKSR